jgi:3-isopropylmalate/(R)-2-methylmalate dehydratase small subunit
MSNARQYRGRVWKYGDAVNTDVIFPGKYTHLRNEPREIASHALEDLDPGFATGVKPDDIVVAGRNFGCGSSREQAVDTLKYAGVRVIVAKSFARIFFRNCVNQGVLPIVCAEAVDAIETGETITVDIDAQRVETDRGSFSFPPLSPTSLEIIEAGGLIPMVRRRLGVEHLPMPDVPAGD